MNKYPLGHEFVCEGCSGAFSGGRLDYAACDKHKPFNLTDWLDRKSFLEIAITLGLVTVAWIALYLIGKIL